MKGLAKIDTLIVRVLSGNATEKEQSQLNIWVQQSLENKLQYENLKKIWEERSSEPIIKHSDELAKRIWSKGIDEC